jgi:hypothetical protein
MKGGDVIKDYLAAGYPALCVLTHEPHRIDEVLPFNDDKWRFFSWDCIRGVRSLTENKIVVEIQDPVAAVNWLDRPRCPSRTRSGLTSGRCWKKTTGTSPEAPSSWNIARTTLYSKIKKYDLQKDG